MNVADAARTIGKHLGQIPRRWIGAEAILAMRDGGSRHWRQMEWIGFYFQFLCERYLRDIVNLPGPRHGRVSFDAFLAIPWDFKAHAVNTMNHQVIVNDSAATAWAIKEFGAVGLVLAVGEVEYNDESRSFQKWHQQIKGGMSRYEQKRVARGAWSRLRKTSFTLEQLSFIRITDDTLIRCGTFQMNFRNSNDRPRRPKVLINLEQLHREEMVHYVDFA